MRLLVITSLLGSATSFADKSTEARVGPATKTVPNLAAAARQRAASPKASHTETLLVFPQVTVRRLRGRFRRGEAFPSVRTERSAFRVAS